MSAVTGRGNWKAYRKLARPGRQILQNRRERIRPQPPTRHCAHGRTVRATPSAPKGRPHTLSGA